jgi:hypothetical protein
LEDEMQLGFNLPISGPLSAPETVTRLAQQGEALGYDYLTPPRRGAGGHGGTHRPAVLAAKMLATISSGPMPTRRSPKCADFTSR